ncbi:MAG: metal ABC transporter permease [Chitinophagales bacterium]
MSAFWIILVGSLVACSCALLGSFLILRRMAMVGDAIAHAVLPGIVIAFLITESRASLPILIGAAITGMLTTVLIEVLNKKGGLQEDASIGISFTFLFAIGVILISAFAGQVDLDQDCVLNGEIDYLPLDIGSIVFLGQSIPRSVWTILPTFLIILGFVGIGFKGLRLTTFDNEFAAAIGVNVALWHYLLMGAVSLTTVVSFEAVGAILVVAFLVIPPSAAYLVTHKLKPMLVLSCVIGILSAVGGYYLAVFLDSSTAACMAVVSGLIFFSIFVFGKIKSVFN